MARVERGPQEPAVATVLGCPAVSGEGTPLSPAHHAGGAGRKAGSEVTDSQRDVRV